MSLRKLNAFGFATACVLTVVTAVLTGYELSRIDPPMRMIAFELAGTDQAAADMRAQWCCGERDIVRRSIYWDFPFIFCYSITLAWAAAWAVRVFRSAGLNARVLGTAIVAAPVVAGLLDAVEDVALLRILDGSRGEFFPRTAMLTATVKFMLCGYAALFAAGALVVRLAARQRD